MGHIKLNLSDTVGYADDPNAAAPAPYRETYEVVRELFKRGRPWEPGEQIDLDPATADRLIETGDIKEIA